MDIYGHPMSAGTSISAAADRGVVSGNLNSSLPDTRSNGAGITSFSIMLANSDKASDINPPIASQLIVTVSHPVYGAFTFILDSGTMQ
jgi:hypothetical protein